MAIDTGLGTTITFSGFTAEVTEVAPGSPTIDTIDTSHLGTTGNVTKTASDLVDAGEATFTFQFDPTLDYPAVGGAAASLTITWPSQTSSATYVGTAIVTSLEYPSLAVGQLQEGNITFEYDGVTGPTWTKGT